MENNRLLKINNIHKIISIGNNLCTITGANDTNFDSIVIHITTHFRNSPSSTWVILINREITTAGEVFCELIHQSGPNFSITRPMPAYWPVTHFQTPEKLSKVILERITIMEYNRHLVTP
jgi:hypothetical protein